MATVYLGVGSNVEAAKHLRLGLAELAQRFGTLHVSNVYRSKSLGFEGDDFLNLVVGVETDASPAEVCETIADIHELANRKRSDTGFAPRTLDIDLLLYDDLVSDSPPTLPRSDVLKYSFVLGPLAEIAPKLRHPVTGRTIEEHWSEFDRQQHPLETVDLVLPPSGSDPTTSR